MSQSNNKKVYGAAILFTLIVGFSFLGVKACISVATPLEILVHRFNFAFLCIAIPAAFGMVKIEIWKKKKANILMVAGCYVMFMILQTIGLVFATSIEAGIIFAIIPILAKILGRLFLKEGTTLLQNLFTCVSVAAVIAMFVCGTADIKVNFTGLVILFISSIFMASSNVLMRGVRASYTPTEIAYSIAMVGFIVFNVAVIATGLKNGTLGNYFMPLTNMKFLIAILYLGIPSTVISSQFMSYMLAHMEAMKATVFGNLSTAISILAGAVILREPLQLYHIICTGLIIVGVIGVSWPSKSAKKLENEEENKLEKGEE